MAVRAVVVFHTNRLIPPPPTPPPSARENAACFSREENYFFRLLNTRWEFIINTDGVSAILKYSPRIFIHAVCVPRPSATPRCRYIIYTAHYVYE